MKTNTFMNEYDHLLRVVIVGNTAVGKSSLMLRYSENIFEETFLPTIGVDFKIKQIILHNKTIKFQLWDTAGQERFRTITSSYYRGSNAFIMVYDITDKHSFQCIEDQWINTIKQHAKVDAIQILIGNKSDLEWKREVTREQGQELADKLGVQFMETSAKENSQIEKAFISIAEKYLEQTVAAAAPQQKGTILTANNEAIKGKKLNCCLQ